MSRAKPTEAWVFEEQPGEDRPPGYFRVGFGPMLDFPNKNKNFEEVIIQMFGN